MFSEKELFYKDAYLKECDTKVVSCVKDKDLYKVILEETIFYPEGGGQSSDLGMINDAKVTNVKRENDEIVHYVEKPLNINENVHLKIDWNRRFDHMQNHTGEHILSGTIHKLYGYENVGFHMDEEKIQADYDGILKKEDIEKIEFLINDAIHQNIPVVETYPDNQELEKLEFRSKKELSGKVRIVSIDDVDVCACCGTHVKTTAEVNLIKILSFEKHKTGTRIEMKCGNRALKDYSMIQKQNTALYQMFSVQSDGVYKAVEKQNEQLLTLQKQFINLSNQYLKERALNKQENDYLYDILEYPFTMQSIREYANALSEKASIVCVVAKKDEDSYLYLLTSKNENVTEVSKKINQLLNGKGGGKNNYAQGSINTESKDLSKILEDILKERK